MSIQLSDFLICGGGIVGLTIARELVKRGYENIIILEKEKEIGMHASGWNSGVLHAGIYYSPDSLRARLCLKGNFLMKQYCKEKGIHISDTGKVIVVRNEDEVETLKDLYNRATKNGAKVQMVREIALTEPQKYFFRDFFKDVKALVKKLRPEDVIPSDKAGIRPQLVDWDSKKLVADFLVINDINSIHILNAISPAFTSSMAFAEFIVENYIKNN